MIKLVPAVTVVGLLSAVTFAREPVAAGEWRAYGGDKSFTKYSALDQIDKDNVKTLRVEWRQSATPETVRQTPNAPVPYNYENTPLMVDGLLYISTGYGTVAALNPETGAVVWFDSPVHVHEQSPVVPSSGSTPPTPSGASARSARSRVAPVVRGTPSRSVAYWTDGKDSRILAITGQSLVALSAKTGKRYDTFGEHGEVDLSLGYDRDTGGGYKWGGPPIVVGDVVVVGGLPGEASDVVSEKQRARFQTPPGDIRGYDVRTGKRLWIFHTVPQLGEFGAETWLKESWSYSGNAGVWGFMSADEDLGYVYLPIESALDYYGASHPGDNLFADSLLCLDAKTGKRVWHFQANHHGVWDYDFTTAPVLADVTIGGRRVKLLAEASKQGFLYVLDRVTGEPIWPIEERPARPGHAPGEWYAPTQPFPTKPPAYEQQGVSIADLIDFTPDLRREATEIINRYNYGPLFTPFEIPGTSEGKDGTILMPSSIGGTNWNGPAFDPESGVLYVSTVRAADVIQLVKSEHPDSNVGYVRRNAFRVESWVPGPQGLPSPFKPPYGSLVAIDLHTGDLLWRVPNGDGPRNHPALAHLHLPPLGQPGRVAPLATKTLLFLGEGTNAGGFSPPGAGGKKFRAYDKATGKVVWEMELPGGTTGAPMTYMSSGRQFIVVAVGWSDMPAELIALALPRS
jgi:quinoprotein glucose dehydrogenase